MGNKSTLAPAAFALMDALAEHHSPEMIRFLMAHSLSGVAVSHPQAKRARRRALDQRYAASGERARDSREQERAADAIAAAALRRRYSPPGPSKPPLTLEQQLAKIAAGAAVVPTFKFQRPDPSVTLGGVSAGML